MRTIILLLCLLLFSSPVYSQVIIEGKVVGVADGDTITVLDRNKRQHKIRLYGIDTPEKKQTYGQAAKKYTASLATGKTVKVIAYDTDR